MSLAYRSLIFTYIKTLFMFSSREIECTLSISEPEVRLTAFALAFFYIKLIL